ncbi:DNA-directed RNA polymerase [Lunasporangiospora selenospora]|uniref:DNA-directed RNA polymerase n=1 Tax=Lunasporangiospora selenospora TaxID=979761 RepID=A0A9P6FVA3_9FUNG|nr:DNA-directed RNA polymerase [Lunasporangiospora selenospora]
MLSVASALRSSRHVARTMPKALPANWRVQALRRWQSSATNGSAAAQENAQQKQQQEQQKEGQNQQEATVTPALRQQDTAAAAIASNPTKLEPIRIIRLPDARTNEKEPGKFSDHQLPEQLAVMYACLNTGELERARRIFQTLQKSNPDDMLVIGDIRMHNSFMESYMGASPSPRTKEALKWFESLPKYKVKPDLTSFAIIIRGFVKMDSMHTAKVMMMEMQKAGYSIDELRRCPNLQEEDVERMEHVVKMLKPSSANLGPLIPEKATSVAQPKSQFVEAIPVRNSKDETVIGVKLMRSTLDALSMNELDLFEKQLKLEERSYQSALDRIEYDRTNMPDQINVKPLREYLWRWHQSLRASIKEELKRVDNVLEKRSLSSDAILDKDRMQYGPFLKLLSPDKLSLITILELLRLNNSGGIVEGMKSARALISIGKAIESEYNAEQMTKKSNKALFDQRFSVHQLYGNGRLFNMAIRKAETKRSEELYPTDWTPVWPESTRAKVGSVLTTLLMDCAKVQIPSHDPETNEKIVEEIPAFYHAYQYSKGQRIGVIKVHSHISEILSTEPVRDVIHPSLLPMLVLPRPWLSYNDGGYLNAQSTIMRIRHCPEQFEYLRKAHTEGLLFRVYNGLDVLGKTRWAVNKKVLNVMLEAWNTGKEFGKIPAAIGEYQDLEKPEDYETSTRAKSKWLAENRKLKVDAKNHHSLRCDVNYKIEIARAFADQPMYFPHNLDFRGRAYPIPPLFNHLGNDLCRGLLQFDEPKPLGAKGFTWLKIHLANLAGFDKHSLPARAQYTMDHLDDIFDSSDNPMGGRRWWLKAEDPWQCLATCNEIANAIRSGDPETYMSHVPVHQDGTCNGLQHYAALGGDIAGAQQVNLVPSDAPQDVYSGVAQAVERMLEKQAAEGVESAQTLVGKVTRKIVKQTVMTNVYGVTFVGARAQIENRLKETPGIPEDQVRQLSTFLTQQVFASIGEMFTGARAIQDWLAESARRIAKSIPTSVVNPETDEIHENLATKKRKKASSKQSIADQQMTSVIWTTPLNLPIVQPYRKMEHKQVRTNLQSLTIRDPTQTSPVNVQKQRTAFPPNFIHSLDATHMLMSATGCVEEGLTFASVHDSYWTHAKDVDVMNEVLRKQFIQLHSNNIMENLLNEFTERYKDYLYPVTLVVANPGEPVGEGMIAWDDERVRRKFGKIEMPTGEKDEFMADPEAPADEAMLPDKPKRGKKVEMFHFEDDEDDEHDLSSVVIEEDEEELEAEAKAMNKALRKKQGRKKAASRLYHSWEPLTFPPLPDRGDFDVAKVADSDYFFS